MVAKIVKSEWGKFTKNGETYELLIGETFVSDDGINLGFTDVDNEEHAISLFGIAKIESEK